MKSKSLLRHPYQFAAAGGVFWGLTLFLATIIAVNTGYGMTLLNFFGGIYPGYSISYVGAVNILFFGFMDGFIFCYLVAFFFGKSKKLKPKAKQEEESKK